MQYRFGEFELDTEAYTLTRSGLPLHLRPKVFDLLRFLIERRERMVTKQELLDALWEAEHVSEGVLPWAVSHARRALGQKSRAKAPIETLYSRGYRWRAAVEVVDQRPGPAAPSRVPAEPKREALPFVGRSELMASLRDRLAVAQAGRGGLCLLVGEPGIGKTRCMDELVSSAAGLGFSVWSGRATQDPWARPLWPWTQVLRNAAHERGPRDRAAQLLAQLGSAGAARSEHDATQAAALQRERFVMLDDVSRFLLQASQRKPLLVLLDDLHWADAGTIALLAAIAPELRRHPLLIVASQRDRPGEYRVRRPPQLARHAERIELAPLTTADVAQYIGLVTCAGSPDAALSAAVHNATAGNALFLQETVRALIAQHGASGLLSLSAADVKPPHLARQVLGERLDLLDPVARSVLATASVLGESFDTDLLHKVSGVPVAALIAALDEATGAQLVSTESAHRYRFCHVLVRSVLYDELSAQTRIAAHRRAAEAIERTAHVVPRQRELAHHYYRSLALGQAGVVVAAARKAAEETVRSGEFEDAAMFCQWALEAQALDLEATARERAELLLLRARSARHAGQDHDARAAIAQLVDVAHRHGFADLLVRAARVLRPGRTWTAFADPVARTALEEALRISQKSELDESRISALSQLASVPPYARDMERSKTLSATALELARKVGKPALLAEALRARLYALSGPDDIDALLSTAQEALALDGDAESWISISAHSARYGAAIHRGDLVAADGALAALGHAARKQRRPEALWYHERLRAQRHFVQGVLSGAEAAFAKMASVRFNYDAWRFRVPQALLAIDRHGAPDMLADWDLTAFLSRTDGLPTDGASVARIAVKLGRQDLARPVLERLSAGDFGKIPKDISYLNTLVNLSPVVIALRDRPRAECLYALLAPYPHHNTPSTLMYYEGSVSHDLALLAEFLGDRERAHRHFEDALVMNQALDHKAQLARTYFEYARFLRAVGTPSRARHMKSEAGRLAETLGMTALAQQAHAL
jgi:DNA-binding winged helix-turn-helix (wHTH) protein